VTDLARAFGGRFCEPSDAVSVVRDGMHVAGGLIEPTDLLLALAQAPTRGEATLAACALGGLALGQTGRFRLRTAFATPASRPLAGAGVCEYLPLTFARGGAFFRAERFDVVFVRLAPPDEQGRCSFGWAAGYTPELLEMARARGIPIVAEIDPAMPRTHSGREVPVEAISRACLATSPAAVDTPVPASPHAPVIAAHLRELVPDGATLQVGIGSVPDAAVALLDRRGLGIHTEVLGPGLVSLFSRGFADNAHKSEDRGLTVTTIASIDPSVFDFVDGNRAVAVRGADEVLDPRRIARHAALRCINSAISVDLRGQADAETVRGEQVAGVGGQLDFFRGAGLVDDALRIIAMESTAGGGRFPRIVRSLGEGSVVTSTRYDIDYVVTEHGVARLGGRTDEQRRRSLIDVADPAHRDALRKA
jgi:4-hydroxybutyrate CoA-transferase